MNKDINNIQKLYESQEQSITVKDWTEVPKGYIGHVNASGTQYWVKNGKLHREDGPALITEDGLQFWYKKGLIHREDGPAVIGADGHQEWWIDNNQYSKEEFDAIHNKYTGHIKFANGTQKWFKNGQWHREDGPAEIWVTGERFWWLNGLQYSRDDYWRELHKRGKISDEELFVELL